MKDIISRYHRRTLWLVAGFACAIALVRANPTAEGKTSDELRKVRTVIETALKDDPQNSELWVHLGLVERKLDRVDAALEAFERAAKFNPQNANAHFMRGLAYEKKQDNIKALSAWEACLSVST